MSIAFNNRSEFLAFVRSKINQYVELLKEDFINNPAYAKLASDLLIPGLSVSEIFPHLTVIDFNNFSYSNAPFDLKIFNDFESLDGIHCPLPIPEKILSNPYQYFSKFEFQDHQQALDRSQFFYYVFDNKIVSKFDHAFINCLDGYSRYGEGIYKKEISTNSYLKFDCSAERPAFFSPENYYFPTLTVEIAGQDHEFSDDTDLTTFLFLGTHTFNLFFKNPLVISKDSGGQPTSFVAKKDQPVIYSFEEESKYILTNDYKSLARYNRYIYMVTELFFHYFRIFERWITGILTESEG